MQTATVLLVLDELRDLETYAPMLCGLGYKVLMCSSVAEGVAALETEDVSFVIVSQGTSAFEGRQVLGRSLQLRPHVPVLVVARVLDIHCYLEAMDLGAVDYLERPAPQDVLWVLDTQMRRAETLRYTAGENLARDLVAEVAEGNPPSDEGGLDEPVKVAAKGGCHVPDGERRVNPTPGS